MRGLFLLLLISNIAYAIVLYVSAPAEMDVYRGVQLENQGLTLLSELPPHDRPALRDGVKPDPALSPWAKDEEPIQQPPVAEAGKPICLRVAGIKDQTLLGKLRDELRQAQAGNIKTGSETTQTGGGKFWVMLPPYKNKNTATKAAETLQKKGIKDFFVVRSGDYQNAVSLGVFSTMERAQRRTAQIVALKAKVAKPKIETIGQSKEHYWLNFQLSRDLDEEKARALVKSNGAGEASKIRCE